MKLRPFEIGLVAFFAILMAVSLILLRTYTPEPKENVVDLGGEVKIWGTLPAAQFNELLANLSAVNTGFSSVTYRYVAPDQFSTTFINALADQSSPDLLLISHESLIQHRGRLVPYPYTSFALPDFRSRYIDGAEIFAQPEGIYAFPVAVDPLVMYWNRDIFATNNLLSAPSTWEELVGTVVPKLTTLDFNRQVTRSAVALGEYQNIRNAFPVLSMLMFQGGSAGVVMQDGFYKLNLDSTSVAGGGSTRPLLNAITFYSNFNNPNNTLYSWNRSLPNDREQFISERLAIYFGFGSEASELGRRNPNLNFGSAEVPQSSAATLRRTYGRFYGLAIPKQARNINGAYQVQSFLTQPSTVAELSRLYQLAPVERSLLQAGSNDVYGRIIYQTAPIARGWLNPDLRQVDGVLSAMVEEISSGRQNGATAVGDVLGRLQTMY